jgi:3',5'-cyclic AMP phosphodiesterase CpdA
MRFAHFSDVHLLSLDGVRFRDFLGKRSLGGLNLLLRRGKSHGLEVFDALIRDLNEQGVDHVACTGDVTNLALEPEFALGRERFARIDGGPERVTCIPGNHDRYVRSADGLFERYLGEYCRSDPEFDGPGRSWPLVRIRGDLALVGVTTSFPTPWFHAEGEVGEEQLARLEETLSSPELAGRCRVVLVHHPPAGPRAAVPTRGLRDHRDFAAVLARTGAELVLHGHEHQDLRETLPGPDGQPIVVRGIPSGSHTSAHADLVARYRVYRIGPPWQGRPRVVEHETRVYSAELGRFVAHGPPVEGP